MRARMLLAVAGVLLIGCSAPQVRRATLYLGANDALHMGLRGQDIEAGLGDERQILRDPPRGKGHAELIRGLAEDVARRVPPGRYQARHNDCRIEIELENQLLVYEIKEKPGPAPAPPELAKLLTELSGLIKW